MIYERILMKMSVSCIGWMHREIGLNNILQLCWRRGFHCNLFHNGNSLSFKRRGLGRGIFKKAYNAPCPNNISTPLSFFICFKRSFSHFNCCFNSAQSASTALYTSPICTCSAFTFLLIHQRYAKPYTPPKQSSH